MPKTWPDDFPRGQVEPINNKQVADLWIEVARARRALGDKEGAARAFYNSKHTRLQRRARRLLAYGRRLT